MKITNVEAFRIHIPWKKEIREYMMWARQPEISWFYKVYTSEGIVGLCENYLDVRDKIPQIIGKSPLEFIFDDSYWPLQEAMYDIMAQHLNVPIYKLLGKKQRDKVSVCYWAHHFPPDVLAKESAIAADKGFTTIKFKVRPRFDPVEQVKSIALSRSELSIIPDANGTLWLPSRAIKFAGEIEGYNIFCLESPIPHSDVDGYLAIRSRVNIPIAAHMGSRCGYNPLAAISRGMCDYYVLEEPGVELTKKYANIAEAASGEEVASGNEGKGYTVGGRPVWLEGFGRTGVSEAFQVHLCAAVKMAMLPSPIFIHCLREHPLVEEPLEVKGGYVEVPDKPGQKQQRNPFTLIQLGPPNTIC